MADDLVVLYTNPTSRGRIARWMLEEIGIPYRREILTFGGTMKSGDYRALNPMGKVPTIVHDGKTITECAAICAYLADAFPQASLAPPPRERADYYRWLFFAAGPVEASVANRALGVEVPPDRKAMVGYSSYEDVLDTLQAAIDGKQYIAADYFTAADLYVGAHLSFGLRFGSIEERPGFRDYMERMTSRPAAIRANQLDDADMKETQGAG